MSVAGELGGVIRRSRARGRPPWLVAARCEPPLRRFLLAQGVSRMGDYLAITALPFAVFATGGGAAQVGLLLTGESISVLALLLFGGVIGDRWQRRWVMIVADLLRAASQAAIAILLLCGAARPWQLLLLLIVAGAGTALFQPAASGLMPALVSEDRLQAANGLRNFVLAGAAVIGPLAAGALIVAASPGWAFALNALSFVLSAALLRQPSPDVGRDAPGEQSLFRDLADGWKEFRSRTWLWAVVAQFSLLNALALAPFAVLGAAVAQLHLGGAAAWSLILTTSGLGEMVGCLLAAPMRLRRPLFLATLGVVVWAAPLALVAIAAPLPAIVAAVLPAGASLGFFATVWDTTLQKNVPEAQLSRLSAYDWLGSLAMLPLGYLLAGSAQATIGATPSLLGAAVLVVVYTVAASTLPSVRAIGVQQGAAASRCGKASASAPELPISLATTVP